jgi:hypothetical protein
MNYGIDKLREMVRFFNNTTESFNQQFTIRQLVGIYEAYKRSEYDITPDRWTQDNIRLALIGKGCGATSEKG